MGISHYVRRAMVRVVSSRWYQLLCLAIASLAVFGFYYFAGGQESFSSATRKLMLQANHGKAGGDHVGSHSGGQSGMPVVGASKTDGPVLKPQMDEQFQNGKSRGEDNVRVPLVEEPTGFKTSKAQQLGPTEYHVLMMFTKVNQKHDLQEKFKIFMKSLVMHSHFEENELLHMHLVCDEPSRALGQKLLDAFLGKASFHSKVTVHGVGQLAEQLHPIVEPMQSHFSAGSGSYFNDAIFFMSVAMHLFMPREMERIVQLDLDLKLMANIRLLFSEFDKFGPDAVIGIAHEMQPVYRHAFWQYRKDHPGTHVGEPPADGLPGFNSGVLLLDLVRMRNSAKYTEALTPSAVKDLATRFSFRGHLGDQDFFTVLGAAEPHLFHVLPCGWNRQLCTWWRDHGYADVFDRYFACDQPVRIYHGNCNTPIPDE
ncbi:xyloside xylosyltransferase 1 [Lethenteron reissneri]|uniref:xyloside xylosyltransferase 1 n=1 Tax=Lethenteron reissneri TaxID=7753 RepID=UPI002AB795EC|nr:xyloside xylosyltransferase 1 [Lethenteron reissneri]XP_061428849.1 xyloside xylosyltransferase 1 [Lethenteron reissneri]XP_061428858.1 xyloside xylosyltransferase 1 [Lethenteron reissneri]